MHTALFFIFLLLQLAFAIYIVGMCVAFVTGAPFVPTQNPAAASMIRLSRLKKGDRVYDLGSGDGKLLFVAAAHGARATGYEINPILVLWTNVNALVRRNTRVRALWKNFWRADIHDADVVLIYLLPWKMDRLAQKIKRDCKKGTLVVSNSFIFPDWEILRSDPVNHIYVFKV